ncbi:MAG: tetratricopeptide repeat protein [Thermoleophilia bacterium]
MSTASRPRSSLWTRLPPRRLAILLGVWAVAAGVALLLAWSMDSPVGAGEPDAARPAVPDGAATETPQTTAGQLPPLALVLDRPLPDGIGDLAPMEQIARLQARADQVGTPRSWVELGSILQLTGQPTIARQAYAQALSLDPDDVDARLGQAMSVDGRDPAALANAAQLVDVLARRHPDDQTVAFNQAWVAIYQRRAAAAEDAWKRTIALGADTRLGRSASALLATLRSGGSGSGSGAP